MIRTTRIASLASTMFAVGLGVASSVQAQPSSVEMETLREQVQDDKKVVIEANLNLTAAQAAEFWPIYDEYQIELERLNSRIGWLIRDFGAAYDAGTISDDDAEALLDEVVSIDEDEAAALKKYARQIRRVIPPAEAVRYLQIENKIRAAIRFDLASNIPLFQ